MMWRSAFNDPGNDSSAKKVMDKVAHAHSRFWEEKRSERSLSLFRKAAREVPAYRDFLAKNSVVADKVRTTADFCAVPPVNKKNYLRAYPLPDLVWGGHLDRQLTFAATSGSSGEPVYFPREHQLDWESSVAHELFLKAEENQSRHPTLVIVGFGTGVWIAGLITYKAFEIAGRRGRYPLSVITPGINKAEIFNALRRLAPRYERTILIGYPPFVKDIIDEAPAQGVDVKALRLRLLFAAEAFSESFRDYLVEKTGMKNPLRDTMNIYGTADIGTMAYETPVSIMVRRAALGNERLFDTIFNGIRKTPTLAQFNPFFVNFEEVGGELLLTGDNTVPLIRYELGDHGGVRSFDAVAKDAAECGVDIMSTAAVSGIEDVTYRLPFVHVYERNDFSTSIYGLQIYPEMIREALLHEGVRDHFTGKFTLETQFDEEHNQCLAVHIEMRQDRNPDEELRLKTLEFMLAELKKRSSEYRELHRHIGERANPRLRFWPAEHPEYFKPGGKQKWVKKNG